MVKNFYYSPLESHGSTAVDKERAGARQPEFREEKFRRGGSRGHTPAELHTVFMRPQRQGFTLIETLLYVFLFSLLIGSVILIFYQIVASQIQNRERLVAETEAEFLMRKLMWGLTGAQSVSQPVLGATSSLLSVSKYNAPDNPLVFDVASGTARLSRRGGTPVVLTTGNVNITQAVFTHLASMNNQPEGVQIVLSVAVSSSERSIIASTTLENTMYLR